MPDSDVSKKFSWQAMVAIGGLIATLIGLWINYHGQQEQLREAQAKVQATEQEAETHKQAAATKRAEIQSQISSVDSQIEAQDLEIRRGSAGLQFAPQDQKPLALEIVRSATEQKALLAAKREKLQETLNALPAE
jgi:hypothetical protein